MTRRWVGAAVVAVVLVSGCSSSSGDGKPAAEPKGREASAAGPSLGGPLGDKWRARLDKLDGPEATRTCQDAGSAKCGERLSEIVDEVAALGDAIDAAGGVGAYPKSVKRIADMTEAYAVYRSEGCATSGAGAPAGCYGKAVAITVGVSSLGMTLITDEAKAG